MPQIDAWKSDFGNSYTDRQTLTVQARKAMWERILQWMPEVQTAFEFGAGSGDNLKAMRLLKYWARLDACEINPKALDIISEQKLADTIYQTTIQDFENVYRWDLTFTRGVLIHVPPDELPRAYDALYKHSKRYIVIAEYYSPQRMAIHYRGRMDMLWKADFAGEMLNIYPDLKLIDYGFIYHRDQEYPQDDVTYFTMEKQS